MDNNQTQNGPQPPIEPTQQPNTQPVPDMAGGQTAGTILPPDSSKRRNKLTYVLAFVLAAAAAGGSYLLLSGSSKAPSTPTAKKSSAVLTSAKKQYFLNDAVAGYISYKPEAFKEVTVSKLPQIPTADAGVNVVIVQANIVGFSDSGLYLYDLSTNKTYKLTDGGGSPRIMSDHYLLYAFDTGSGTTKRLGGKLLNLQTGQTQTVFSDTPENVPGTVCCSVSPDGLKAAFVQKNKISIWDINTQKSTDYTATVAPIDPNFSRTSANDYNVEGSYATPAWLDNTTLVYTDKVAASLVVANQPKQTVDDTLYKLDFTSGKSTEIKTDKSGIYNLYVNGSSIFLDEEPMGQTYTQISVIPAGSEEIHPLGINPGFALISPDGNKVYLFATQDSKFAYSTVTVNQDSSQPGTFDPHITGVTVSQILPRGFIDKDRMILAELDTAGTQDHEYIAVYNTATDKVEQYLKIN
jgi:hypothetical protein